MSTPEKQIIHVKQDLNLIFIKDILEFIHNYDCYYCDKRFKELLDALENYVFSRIIFPDRVEILEEYAVYECIPLDDK